MFENYNYEDWKKRFYEETRGKNPEDCLYIPDGQESIRIHPYFDASAGGTLSMERKALSTDQNLLFSDTFKKPETLPYLKDYGISKCYAFASHAVKDLPADIQWELLHQTKPYLFKTGSSGEIAILSGETPGQTLYNLRVIGKERLSSISELWVIPGGDFLFNIGLLRGLYKYFHFESVSSPPLVKAYFEPETHHEMVEAGLPEYTSRVLSSLIAGVDGLIWKWPSKPTFTKNFYLFLNIAEILIREGNVGSYGDALTGAHFFETLSSEIHHYITSE